MEYKSLVKGYLLRRYKRFLADVRFEDGTTATVHCPNSGSMLSCLEEGAEVYCSPASDPKRKTRFTWEMIRINNGWIGINTSLPNVFVFEWVKNGILPGFNRYTDFRREVTSGDSRFDIFCRNEDEECFVEVKNVTLKVGDEAQFPDSVTTRGKKHLETLILLKKSGKRAIMVYTVQRMDVSSFAPAKEIDPEYAGALERAVKAGVEVLVVKVEVTPGKISYHSLMEYHF